MSFISAENIAFHYGSCPIFKGINFDIQHREVIAILGANGAGKTTLLKLLCGDLPPSEGGVSFDGRPLSDWSARELAQRRAVLPQSSTLDFAFNVEEVVLMGRTPHIDGSEKPKDLDICRSALKKVHMQNYWGRLYTTLSGGERQRIHLARVLAQLWDLPIDRPGCLFLDEPTSSLDLAHQHVCLKIAKEFAASGGASVVVLHDLNLALRYADRVLVLHEGEMIAQGITSEVLTPQLIKKVFQVRAHYTKIPGRDYESVLIEDL
jgi:iron complex transport system ATP-binding protein